MTLRAPSRRVVVITSGTNSFHRRGGPPPSKREVLGFRRSRPAALTSIGYRGFAVAHMTLRAPFRSHLYNPGDERARNARPYGGRTPSTAAAVPLPRRGRSWGIRRSKPAALPSIGYRGFAVAPITLRAPADILPTFDFPIPIPPSSREGDRPVGGGRSKQAVEGVLRRWKA